MREGTRVVVDRGTLGTVHGTILALLTPGYDHTVLLDSGYTVGVTAGGIIPEEQTEIRVRVPSDLTNKAFNLIEDTLIEFDIHFSMDRVDIRRGRA